MEWKDTTTYSRGQTEKVQTVWTFEDANIRITVMKNHMYYSGKWIFHCFSLGLRNKTLGSVDELSLEAAQEKAVSIVRRKLTAMILSIS